LAKHETLSRLGGFVGFQDADRLTESIELLDEAGFGRVQPGNVPGFLDETDRVYTKELDKALSRSRVKPGGFHMCFCGVMQHERWSPKGSHHNWCTPDPVIHEEAVGRYIRAAEVAVSLGFKVLVTHISSEYWWPSGAPKEQMRHFAVEGLKRVAEPVKKLGAMIAVENLTETMGTGFDSSADGLNEIVTEVGSDVIGVCIDTGHANLVYHRAAGDDPATTIRALKGKIISTHIHDNDGVGDQHLMPGLGNMDWEKIKAAFIDIDYGGPFEYETGPKNLDGLEARLAVRENFKAHFPNAL